jgi:hypothetical protein
VVHVGRGSGATSRAKLQLVEHALQLRSLLDREIIATSESLCQACHLALALALLALALALALALLALALALALALLKRSCVASLVELSIVQELLQGHSA